MSHREFLPIAAFEMLTLVGSGTCSPGMPAKLGVVAVGVSDHS
jgi:hypothetical protein